jgi:hypothetical protein
MTKRAIMIETVEVDRHGNRQIGAHTQSAELLRDRRGDIQAAVVEAAGLIQESVDSVDEKSGWNISKVEATFGIALKVEAGIIISRVASDASFQIKVTVERP